MNAMQCQGDFRRQRRLLRMRRPGSVLIWCALLLPVLVAMVGLTIDGGLMLAAYREAQNAADAAAIAAAYELSLGKSVDVAASAADTYVQDSSHNNLSGATVTVNIPPTVTNYTAYQNARYAEVIVTYPIKTHFIQVFVPGGPSVSSNQTVQARAIAGFEPIAGGEGVMALNPNGVGLSGAGNAILKVNGPIFVNSTDPNAMSPGKYGMYATDIELAESTGQPSNIYNYSTSASMTANIGQPPQPDYLAYLPTPTTANGVDASARTVPSGGGTMQPGIYTGGINLSGNGTYTMQPGIYVMKGGGFSVSGNVVLTGSGVMIYNTGNDYTASSGAPDNTDPLDLLNQTTPTTKQNNYGGFSLNSNITLTPINTALYTYSNAAIAAFNGMVYYQRRDNTQAATLSGSAGGSSISGTMYAKYAILGYSGQGTTSAQFVFSTINLTGNGTITIQTVGATVGQAPRVFLVE
jgi:Flp pilus assembly protein TadG